MKADGSYSRLSIDAQFSLACAWQARGNLKAAESGFVRILDRDPGFSPAYSKLGEVMEQCGKPEVALEYFRKSLELNPNNAAARIRQNYLKDFLCTASLTPPVPVYSLDSPDCEIPENPNGKINLNRQTRIPSHRSGWMHTLKALEKLHNSQGVMFDGFLEDNFAWKHWLPAKRSPEVLAQLEKTGRFDLLATSEERGITPYRKPWVGCIHNPQGMPDWFYFQFAPQTIFEKSIWKDSLENCLGFFAFSEYHADWLREQTGRPVSVLVHPTEIPDRQFDFQKFLSNPEKKVVQIGWWLRRLSAIYQLPLARDNRLNYQKLRLIPMFNDHADSQLRDLIRKELEVFGWVIADAYAENTREEFHLSNNEYDELLSCNIGFACLYDASANNAVIECIARATPLLVNPLPAVVEYLGDEYPFYFSDLAEAAEKALDVGLIERTHQYLKTCPTREKLHQDYFLRSFVRSGVYRAL